MRIIIIIIIYIAVRSIEFLSAAINENIQGGNCICTTKTSFTSWGSRLRVRSHMCVGKGGVGWGGLNAGVLSEPLLC